MPLKFGDVEITDVVFNDTPIDRVEYNGVVVFEKSSFPWMRRQNGVTTQDGKATVTFEDLNTGYSYAAGNFIVQPISCSSTAQTTVSVSFDAASNTVTVELSPATSSLTFDLIALPVNSGSTYVTTATGEWNGTGTYTPDITFFNCTQFNGTGNFDYAVEETTAKITASGLTSLIGYLFTLATLNMDAPTVFGPYWGWNDDNQGGRHDLDKSFNYFCPSNGTVSLLHKGAGYIMINLYVNNELKVGSNNAAETVVKKGDLFRLAWSYIDPLNPGTYSVTLTPTKTT